MLVKILGIIAAVLLIGTFFFLNRRINKQRKKKNQAAFDILKEDALCNALTNPVLTGKIEDRYQLEDKVMLQLITKQAKKKVNYIFNPEKVITFGRNPKTSDVCLRDPIVSGTHCTIFKSQNEVWIKDMGSSNGTIVKRKGNRCVLGNEEAIELKNKDIFQIGEISFRVKLFFINKKYL
ncbi:FHA domain-containing protein [Anaerosporobacter sp.]